MEFALPAPNYEKYTLDELNDTLKHIDQIQFPERTLALKQQIFARQNCVHSNNGDISKVANKKLYGNFISKHWNGGFSLPVSYWVIGVLVNVLIVVLSKIAKYGIENSTSTVELGGYILALYIAMIVLLVWQTVGLFRSANFHPQNGGSEVWAIIAKILVSIGVLNFSYQMYVSGIPIMNNSIQLLLGVKETQETKFRILNEGKDLELIGRIEIGSELLLQEKLKKMPNVKTLHLHSEGGRILAAKRMMKIITEYKLDTYVREECASACTLLFLAGENKFLAEGGRLKFHNASIGTVSGHEVTELSQKLKQVYVEQAIPKWFIDKVLETPSKDFWLPSNEDLLKANVVDKFVDPDIYPMSGLGEASEIKVENVEEGLLTQNYMMAMKKYDHDSYQKIVDINFNGLRKGISQASITSQVANFIYDERLPVYLKSAGNSALVEYWKVQVLMMEELQKDYPLACASMVYFEEVPAENRYGNEGQISQKARQKEGNALAMLIKSFNKNNELFDKETQQVLVRQLLKKINTENEDFMKVVVSAQDFVEQPDLMCAAAIALNKGFISFDEETSGKLLRSINN